MEKNNKVQLSCFLVLILFFTVVGVGSAFAHGGGGGGGDGGGISDSVVKGVTIEGLETLLGISFDCDCNNNSIVDILEIDEVPVIFNLPAEDGIENPAGELVNEDVNTQSADPTAVVKYVEPMTDEQFEQLLDFGEFAGGIAVAYGTGGSSTTVSALAGGAFTAVVSVIRGRSGEDATQATAISTVSGYAPGGPIGQAIAGQTLNEVVEAQGHMSHYDAPTNNPGSGAELNSTTEQVTQR